MRHRSQNKTKKKYLLLLYSFIGILIPLVVYQLLSVTLHTAVLPDLFKIIANFGTVLAKSETYINFLMTFFRLFLVLVISAVLGLALGVIAGYYEPINRLVRPTITLLKAVPTICIIMVLLVFTKLSTYIVLFLVIFPIIFDQVKEGTADIKSRFHDELALAGKREPLKISKIIVPLSIPHLLLGILQSLGLGLKVVIMAEIISGSTSDRGIGNLINIAFNSSKYLDMFTYSLLAVFLILICDFALSSFKKRVNRAVAEQ